MTCSGGLHWAADFAAQRLSESAADRYSADCFAAEDKSGSPSLPRKLSVGVEEPAAVRISTATQ